MGWPSSGLDARPFRAGEVPRVRVSLSLKVRPVNTLVPSRCLKAQSESGLCGLSFELRESPYDRSRVFRFGIARTRRTPGRNAVRYARSGCRGGAQADHRLCVVGLEREGGPEVSSDAFEGRRTVEVVESAAAMVEEHRLL